MLWKGQTKESPVFAIILRPFLVIFCGPHKIFSQKLGSDAHFEVRNVSVGSTVLLCHKTQIFPMPDFGSLLEKYLENLRLINCHFKTIPSHLCLLHKNH